MEFSLGFDRRMHPITIRGEQGTAVSLALISRNFEVSPESRFIRGEEFVLFIHPAVPKCPVIFSVSIYAAL